MAGNGKDYVLFIVSYCFIPAQDGSTTYRTQPVSFLFDNHQTKRQGGIFRPAVCGYGS